MAFSCAVLPYQHIRLIVFLDLQKTPSGYKISCQEDHVLWSESILTTFPALSRLWTVYGRRITGLGIVFLMQVAILMCLEKPQTSITIPEPPQRWCSVVAGWWTWDMRESSKTVFNLLKAKCQIASDTLWFEGCRGNNQICHQQDSSKYPIRELLSLQRSL